MRGLPAGWGWTELAQVCTSITDGDHQPPPQVPSGVPFLVIGNVRDRALNFAGCRHVSPEYFESLHPIRRPQKGDVLYTLVGSYGIPVLVRDDRPFCVQRHIGILRPSPEIDSTFLALVLSSPAVLNQATNVATGTAQLTVPLSGLRHIQIPLPPREEQARLVAAIQEQFSRIDAGTAALQRIQRNLMRMRAALLKVAVTGRLVPQRDGEGSGRELLDQMLTERSLKKAPASASDHVMLLPESWAVASLEALTDPERPICYGILMPRVKEAGVVPYVEVKDLRAKRLSVNTLHRTSQELHEAFPRSILAAGDVVLAIRGSFDRASVVPDEVAGANVSRDVARIAPLDGLDPDFLAAYLTSPPSLQYLRQHARGVAVKGVNIADLRRMPIPLPPVAEQRRISKELQRQTSIMDDVLHTIEQAHSRSDRLRSSTLAAAFSGELVTQGPIDEPASVLLERIAAARPASNSQPKTPGRKYSPASTRTTK